MEVAGYVSKVEAVNVVLVEQEDLYFDEIVTHWGDVCVILCTVKIT